MKRLSLLLLLALPARVVLAQPTASSAPPPASAPPASAPPASAPPATSAAPAADLTQAKELFRKGNALLQSNQPDLALDLFLQSRALVPGVGNTTNAAICLDRLGRFDEAIFYYELVLKESSDRLSDDERRSVATALTTLRRKVGTIDVAANVDGVLVIDGRRRGELPLQAPIRVLPGPHTVRVLKDGHTPAEAVVEVKVGEEKAVDLKLEVLTSTGRLHVVDTARSPDTEVLVDGAPVGRAPWEGTLGVGRHVIVLQGKEQGTAPQTAVVVAGQTVEVSLRTIPIGPPLRLDPTPLTATVFVDDVLLGAGPWQGRLPLGPHRVRVVEEGYLAQTRDLDGATGGAVRIELAIDESHPRWRRSERARLLVEAHGGYALGSTLGSDAEASCGSKCAQTGPGALWLGARGVYWLPIGLAFDVGGGYLRATTSLQRSVASTRTPPGQTAATYELHDDLSVAGPYAALGVGYRRIFAQRFRLDTRVGVGAHFASSRDQVTGSAARGSEREEVLVDRSGASVRAVNFFVEPEVGGAILFGRFHVGLGLGLGIFLLDGPRLPLGDTAIAAGATRCQGDASRLACLAADPGRAGERPYGPFLLWLTQINVGATF